MKKVSPQMGGCWFCFTIEAPLIFDFEFDTNLHLECLKKHLEKYPNDPEASLMGYLLEDNG